MFYDVKLQVSLNSGLKKHANKEGLVGVRLFVFKVNAPCSGRGSWAGRARARWRVKKVDAD